MRREGSSDCIVLPRLRATARSASWLRAGWRRRLRDSRGPLLFAVKVLERQPHTASMPRLMRIELPNEAATVALAKRLAPSLERGDRIALDGPMGAGKTTFVRALVAALGGDATRVSSPTYTLLHRYEARIPVIHVDACRLERAEQLTALGFDEQAADGVAAVEWAQHVAPGLDGPRCWHVALDHAAAGRSADVTAPVGATL